MKMKRITALFIVFCSIIMQCGCGSQKTDAGTDSAAASEGSESQTAVESTGISFADADYGGLTFTILAASGDDYGGSGWDTYDLYAESENGDVVNDAVYQRNIWVEELYNIRLAQGNASGTVYDAVKAAVLAGIDDYDAIIAGFSTDCLMAENGYLINLYDIPEINLENSWWDSRLSEAVKINNKLFMATGDITVIDNDATYVMYYNKSLAEILSIGNIYDMVFDGSWTIDNYSGLSKSALYDLNGDGKYAYPDDRFGTSCTFSLSQALMFGCGVTLCSFDADGYPVVETNMEKLQSVIEKAGSILTGSETLEYSSSGTTVDDMLSCFMSGNSLFYPEVLLKAAAMRGSEVDFGLLPFPKYDEAQDSYYCFVHTKVGRAVCVPLTQDDTTLAGQVLEALGYKSTETLTPAYFDKALEGKYLRDEESIEILQLIMNSTAFDLTYMYDWGGIFTEVQNLIRYGKTDLSSVWAATIDAANAACGDTIDAFKTSLDA